MCRPTAGIILRVMLAKVGLKAGSWHDMWVKWKYSWDHYKWWKQKPRHGPVLNVDFMKVLGKYQRFTLLLYEIIQK